MESSVVAEFLDEGSTSFFRVSLLSESLDIYLGNVHINRDLQILLKSKKNMKHDKVVIGSSKRLQRNNIILSQSRAR
eukprot:scaffold3293_cov189-Skeletonema_marinoi.AAC.1